MKDNTDMCKHLRRRGTTYHFVLDVPKDLQTLIGKKVIKRSLKTGDKREAASKAQVLAAEYWGQWNKLRAGAGQELDQNALERNVRAFLDRRLKEDARKRVPVRVHPKDRPLYRELQRIAAPTKGQAMPSEVEQIHHTLALRDHGIEEADYDLIREDVASFMREFGYNAKADTFQYDQIAYELGKALLGADQVALERAQGNVAAAELAKQALLPPEAPLPAPETPEEPEEVYYVADLIPKYIDARANPPKGVKAVSPGTVTKFTDDLNIFVEVAGNLALHQITHKIVADYRDTLLKLPPAWKRDYPGKTIAQLLEMDTPKKMNPNTVNDKVGTLGGFFKWCINSGLMEVNYATDKQLTVIRPDRNVIQRYNKEDLKTIFNAPQYTKDKFRMAWQFWIPILALYTGVRQDALARMRCEEIMQSPEGIWYFDIGKDKSVNGIRQVPLHPVLTDQFNFPAFVESMRKAGHDRVFHDLKPKKLKNRISYGQTVSEWYNGRFTKKLAITPADPDRKKTFHSFRPSAINAAKQAGVHVAMAEETFGHADSTGTRKKSMSYDGYADAYTIKKRYEEVVCLVDFDLDLGHLINSRFVNR